MGSKTPSMYDVCDCNHEAMSHTSRVKACFFNIPKGRKFFRGGFPPDWETEKCGCKSFKFNANNTANPKPSIQGDN